MELPNAADFLTRQDALQSEASEVLNDLDILTYLGKAGEVVLVGSYPLGLMVWRDIDVYVYCAPLSADRAFTALRPLASHLGVVHLNFDNWRGPNGTPAFPDGYYSRLSPFAWPGRSGFPWQVSGSRSRQDFSHIGIQG